MACNRFTVLTLLLLAVVHAADECESQPFVNFGFLGLIQQALERMELTSVLPGTVANRSIQTFAFAVLPDLLALLIAAGVFYFLSSAMQVPKRERKPSEQNSDVEEESSIDLSQIPEISGCTPLHWAAHNGLYRDVELLLTSGVNVNATDNYLETPLHMAARCGYVDICDILLDFGADPRVLNKNQKTPLLIAALSGHSEICDLLSPVKLARRPAPVKGLAIKETKLEHDPHDATSTTASSPRTEEEELTFGCNDLHWAALRCSLPELRVALAKIPVDSTDPWGDTALHLATRAGAMEICATLCSARANPLVLNKDRKTPLDVARVAGHHEISKLLEEFC
eukprot:s352_g45.t1